MNGATTASTTEIFVGDLVMLTDRLAAINGVQVLDSALRSFLVRRDIHQPRISVSAALSNCPYPQRVSLSCEIGKAATYSHDV